MLRINQIESDGNILVEVENVTPDGEIAGKIYKNIGIFLRPSTDYGDVAKVKNISSSEDYYNVLKNEELSIVNIENINSNIETNIMDASAEAPIVFSFEKGDGYKKRLSLIKKQSNDIFSSFKVGAKIKIELNYSGNDFKRIKLEIEYGGELPDA